MTDPLDFDGLVEMAEQAIRNAEDPYETYQSPRLSAEAALRAVLPHVLAGPREALGPLASVADDYDDSEDDALRVLVDADFLVSRLLLGTFRRARTELARIDKLTEGM